ncbi:hypothetical protein TKK_0010948 [Trichogramma kaykai]|uniref:Coiled-coil domain-containing protein 149 n=1 Tax=Trichogramma kaykai TaxID=54128 RepID=A0ABD2WV72_9HYME
MNGVLERNRCKGSSPLHRGVEPAESEVSLLHKKVQVKTQALLVLGQELDQCRAQRDRYKLMVEQLQEDISRRDKEDELKKTINGFKSSPVNAANKNKDKIKTINTLEEDTKLMDLLIESKEQNKCLRLQVDTLKQKLNESQEDIKALRARKTETILPLESAPAIHQREELIEQLERLNVKCNQLKLDLQSVIDEKQELISERDAYKCKAHRLNYELSKALNASQPVDVDSLVNENRYLQERFKQMMEEKELAVQSLKKYKGMLDSKRQKGMIKLGAKSAAGFIMSFKQLEKMLEQGPNIPPQKAAAALTELHSICTALLDSLNDKSVALAHQKKTNKILAARMCELERSIESPTIRLLEGYSSTDIDIRCDSTSLTSDLSEDKESDLQFDESSNEQDISKKSDFDKDINKISTNGIGVDRNSECKETTTSHDYQNIESFNFDNTIPIDKKNNVDESFNKQFVEEFVTSVIETDLYRSQTISLLDKEKIDEYIRTGITNCNCEIVPEDEANVEEKCHTEGKRNGKSAVRSSHTSSTYDLFKEIDKILMDDYSNIEKRLHNGLPANLKEAIEQSIQQMEVNKNKK